MANMVETETCTGCRSCELACSFHHHKIFGKNMGSIHVKRFEKDGAFTIVFYPQTEEGHPGCDCVKGLEACVLYCPMSARHELKAILQRRLC
jgi:Fe-S-cluster-containing hydrogenase component 2